jgi:predicted DCC family thiol-disulfide oxidoreductase YuxK
MAFYLMHSAGKYLLVYDADCGACTRFRRIVEWLDVRERLDYMSLIQADELGLLDSIPAFRRHKSFHLISTSREIESASDAVLRLISLLPFGNFTDSLIRFSSPKSQQIVNFLYTTLSRLHSVGSCAYKTNAAGLIAETRELQELKDDKIGRRFAESPLLS